MQLKIDSSDNRKTIISLDRKTLVKEYKSPQEQDVLAAMAELLGREGKKLADVTAIEVNRGPGAFTSLRVGISVANALKYALGLGKPVEPKYSQPPKITVSGSKSPKRRNSPA